MALVGRRAALVGAQPLLVQRALNRGAKPRDPVLEQIIRRPVLHGLDGDIFAHGPGNQNERDVQTAFAQQLRRPQAAEPRHRIIGENNVRRIFYFRQKVRLGFHPLPFRVKPGAPQFGHKQIRVVRRILDDQNVQRLRHKSIRVWAAG